MKKTQVFVFSGVLIALEIILTRFLAIQTPIVRYGFGFIPISISGILFGPLTAGVTAALADVMGMIIAPRGVYFPGFTISAFITGIIYGAVLYKRQITLFRVGFAVLLVTLISDLVLTTIWISMTTGNAVASIAAARILKSLIMLPVSTSLIYIVWNAAGKSIENKLISSGK
jgi:ECF transporter S component (folate family)